MTYEGKKVLSWKKSKFVTTDSAAAMIGFINCVLKKIKKLSSKFVSAHCILRCEALVAKIKKKMIPLSQSYFMKLSVLLTIFNARQKRKMFFKLRDDMDSSVTEVLLHTKVQ